MNPLTATGSADLDPISADWTISGLLEWLIDDSRQHEPALRHPLSVIDAAVTGVPWERVPTTVALIRSLTMALVERPALARIRVGDLVTLRSQEPPAGELSDMLPARNEERQAQVA